MENRDQFFVVGVYDQLHMAHIVKSLLANHSIECEIINEYSSQVYPVASGGDIAVRIIANKEDEAKINEILSSEFENGK